MNEFNQNTILGILIFTKILNIFDLEQNFGLKWDEESNVCKTMQFSDKHTLFDSGDTGGSWYSMRSKNKLTGSLIYVEFYVIKPRYYFI